MAQQQKVQTKQQNQAKSRITPQKKQIYQTIWRSIFVIVSIVSAVLINKIYIYQTSQQLAHIRKGSAFQLFVFGIPFAILYVTLQSLVHKHLQPKCITYYLDLEKYKTEQARIKRSYTLIKFLFSGIYYLITSVIGYQIIKDTSYMPTWLGGQGKCTDNIRYINSFDQANLPMQIFYILQFGKHFGRFFHHTFIRAQGGYYQFALHHILSISLIFYSYLTNIWLIGVFVLFIHDASDIGLIICRGYRDYRNLYKPLLTVFDIVGMMGWIFCRIFLLSYCCVFSTYNTTVELLNNPHLYPATAVQTLPYILGFITFMLASLQIMQIFWTTILLCSLIKQIARKKVGKNTEDE